MVAALIGVATILKRDQPKLSNKLQLLSISLTIVALSFVILALIFMF